MGYIIFLIFVVVLVAIDLIVGNFFRKPRSARTSSRRVIGKDKNT